MFPLLWMGTSRTEQVPLQGGKTHSLHIDCRNGGPTSSPEAIQSPHQHTFSTELIQKTMF